ncbi:MAG TPA: translation elongation factor 4 [Candidatus Sulfotelmatobacter sp.]|nr:translation elongation factor 4 [Candidatus Sulfotelmatobacter sp.]
MPYKNIRNFAIIAHIDHGKSTLADRFLEITKTISKDKLKEQFLDQNPISRERGITIKLAPVRMIYELDGEDYILDLIDTPGHMDFSYEVSRTLAACEGAILLVDATKGIQAQTVAHFNSAKKEKLVLIPVINKIDLETANTKEVAKDLIEIFGFREEEIHFISAKTGENVEELLKAVIKIIPHPKVDEAAPLKALVFDAAYDEHRGVIVFTKVFDGSVKKHQKLEFIQNKTKIDVSEVGFFSPFLVSKEELVAGEIGYIVTGIKDIRLTRVGDTIILLEDKNIQNKVIPLAGYEIPKPMVFFGVYPKSSSEYIRLRESLNKLALNDGALSVSNEYSAFLGSGFRVGFLGLLHAEIVKERLFKEEGIEPLLTMPRVLYKEEKELMLEPYMILNIFVPSNFVGSVMTVCQNKKGSLLDISYHKTNAIMKYEMPYSMFIRGLSSELKSVTQGFASLDYEIIGYKQADLVKMDILINDNIIDVLSELVYKDEAEYVAREKIEKLKNNLPKQQFKQVIQAAMGARILARTEISPFRKDVLAKMSGGDRTRKDKLLEAQKKGKSKLINVSKVEIPQKALLSMLEN